MSIPNNWRTRRRAELQATRSNGPAKIILLYSKTTASKRNIPPESELSIAAMIEAILDHEAAKRPAT
jgi:hypothetical protein